MSFEDNININSDKQISDYILLDEIGSGGFAKVVQGTHIPTGEKVAIKIMDKIQLFTDPLNLRRVETEISLLKKVRHKNIIKLYEVIETPQKIYLIMEYCEGGELFDYIVKKQNLAERQSCAFFHEIIDALEYLHSLNIVHRDLKPENLLLDKINKKLSLKLIDFGISNTYTMDNLLITPCGTASYAPPEMHKGEKYYGLLTDIWSAGVVLYAMVFGYLPFCDENEDNNIKNIIEGNYEIPSYASPELYDLLLHLLDINPITRYDIDQIKMHPWYNLVSSDSNRPGLIIGYHKIPIDERIINICQSYGYDKNKVRASVANNNYDNNSSIYYIILNKMKTMGIESVSDLNSPEFLNYISDPNNIFFNKNNDYHNKREYTMDDDSSVKYDKNSNNNSSFIKNKCQIYDNISPSFNIQFSIKSIKKNNNNIIDGFNNKDKNSNSNVKHNNYKRIIVNSKKIKDKKIKIENFNQMIKKVSLEKIKKKENKRNQKINHNLYLQTNKTFFINSKHKLLELKDNKYFNDKIRRNESFDKKLTDDIKEKILKLRNPKINNKIKKINEMKLRIQLKIKNKNNKNFKTKKIGKIPNFNKDRKKHTVVHNRNASATPNRYIKNKNNNHININYINNNINIHNIYIQKIRETSSTPAKKHIKNNSSIIRYQKINKNHHNILNYTKNDNYINKNNILSILKNNTLDNIDKNTNNNNLLNKPSKKSHRKDNNNIQSKLSEQRKDFLKILKNIDNEIRCKSARNRNGTLTNRRKPREFPQSIRFISFLNNNNLYKKRRLNNKSNYILKNSFLNDSLINKNSNLFHTSFNKKDIKTKYNTFKKEKNYNKIFISIKKNKCNKNINIKDNCSFIRRNDKLANCISPTHKNNKKSLNISNKKAKNANKKIDSSMILDYNRTKHKKCSSMKYIENNISFNNNKINYTQEYNNINLNTSIRERKIKNSKEKIIDKKNFLFTNKKANNARKINIALKHNENNYKSNYILKKNINYPKKYRGPIDLRNIAIAHSGFEICDEIESFLRKKNINFHRINPYKIICRKNIETIEINIYLILGNININNIKGVKNTANILDFDSNELDVKYNNTYTGFYKNEEITDNYNNKYINNKKNIYYINILQQKDKKNNNKSLFELINKYISNKKKNGKIY